jgi:hypothetical protein
VTCAPIPRKALAGADDDDLRGGNAGDSADEPAVAARVVLEEVRRDLRRHPAADLAERLEDGKRAVGELDLLVRDRRDLLLEEDVDLPGVRRSEVEVPHERLPGLEPLELLQGGAAHLQDEVRPAPDFLCGMDDRGPRLPILLVGESGAVARPALDEAGVPRPIQHPHAHGRDTDPELVRTALFRDPDVRHSTLT